MNWCQMPRLVFVWMLEFLVEHDILVVLSLSDLYHMVIILLLYIYIIVIITLSLYAPCLVLYYYIICYVYGHYIKRYYGHYGHYFTILYYILLY